ncbi:hypothetical protein B0T11DRAFT_333486 [Plectosphaerella cucumerina]|uniref:Uncharacterized protein n=1 Tax=Plectosphaerella cucumerina TaxID=40658 RepID=A0A8K0T8E6_9PEZI|nr:hypothetical protein B0T11DRAFT_333486 [Plectosphaerella cucumerina]
MPNTFVPPRLVAAIGAANTATKTKFPYMPWPYFTDDKDQQLSPTPDILAFLERRGEFKTHLSLPNDTCPVCLDNHNRKDCALVLAEGNLIWGQNELQRLKKTLASLKDDSNVQRPLNTVAVLKTKIGKDGPEAFVDQSDNNNKTAIKHQRSILLNHISILDDIFTLRKSLHEKLCSGRCDRYNHANGECAGASFVEFEKVHTRELEMAEARRKKLERNEERKNKAQAALSWTPMRGYLTDGEVRYRNGLTLFSRMREEPDLDEPVLSSPCAGRDIKRERLIQERMRERKREHTTRRTARREGLRPRPARRVL